LSLSPPPSSPLVPYTTLFRSTPCATALYLHGSDRQGSSGANSMNAIQTQIAGIVAVITAATGSLSGGVQDVVQSIGAHVGGSSQDRKSTRLNSSHVSISYAVF